MTHEQQIKAVDLLPCPFCNNNKIEIEQEYSDDIAIVLCTRCYASSANFRDRKKAIKAWNTRAAMQVREMTVEEVVEVLNNSFGDFDKQAHALAKLGAIRIVEK